MSENAVRKSRSTRAIMGIASVTALTLALAGCSASAGGGAAGKAESVVWADYGGPTNESRQIAFFDPFFAETGIEVVSTSLEDAVMYTQLKGGSGDYDLIQIEPEDFFQYKDNLEPIPDESMKSDTLPEDVRDYAMGGFLIGVAQGWLAETYPDGGPQNWVDFFDVEKYPGKRAWPGAPGSYDASFEIALLADGVPVEDLYPLDYDRAMTKLNSIRDHLIFYESYPEVQTLLATGSAAIAVSVTGQFKALADQGMNVKIQWSEAFLNPNFFVVPKSAKNKEAAFELASWIADSERQAVFTQRTMYGPANESVLSHLDPALTAQLPGQHDGSLFMDNEWRSANLDLSIGTYTDWLAG